MTRLLILGAALLAGCDALCEYHQAGGPYCLPDSGVAPAGQKLSFQIVDQCIAECGPSKLGCQVRRSGQTLTLSVEGRACEPTYVCVRCSRTALTCELPPLEPGVYTVESEGEKSRTLEVRDGGTGASCTAE